MASLHYDHLDEVARDTCTCTTIRELFWEFLPNGYHGQDPHNRDGYTKPRLCYKVQDPKDCLASPVIGPYRDNMTTVMSVALGES